MNYQKVYESIIQKATSENRIKICKNQESYAYYENHHILPKCLGGNDNKENLVLLTAREHFICHKILCEVYPENEKLRYAFWAMCNQRVNRDYIVSSRDYEYAKVLCLEMWRRPKSQESIKKSADKRRGKKINREQSGEFNHNHGKRWVTNIYTNESKMIVGDIPDGYKLGRVKIGSLGKSNSIGKKWYHDPETGEEKYFSVDIPLNWVKGRSKNMKFGGDNLSGKICYFNISLNKEKYFNNDDVIPDGWVRGKLKNRIWFYNPEMNIEKLFDLDSIEPGFIRGRLPKLPFTEEIKSVNEYIRIFKSDVDDGSLVWHRDRESRIIESIGDTDWLVQIDDKLPMKIEGKILIPMGVYHRLIKGTGDLKIKLVKL